MFQTGAWAISAPDEGSANEKKTFQSEESVETQSETKAHLVFFQH